MEDEYYFVYQEFDLVYEQLHKAQAGEKQEKRSISSTTLSQTCCFALEMQQRRIKKRITISDLAKKCSLTTAQLSAFEAGAEVPSAVTAQEILSVIDAAHS